MRVCLQPASGVGKQKRTFFPFCCDEKRLPLQYFCSWHGISVHLKTVCLSECLLWIKKAIHTFQMLLIFAVPQICVRQCDAFVRWIRAIVHPKLSVTCVLITRNFAFGCRDIRFIRALFLCSFTKTASGCTTSMWNHCWHTETNLLLIRNFCCNGKWFPQWIQILTMLNLLNLL